ncbi:MAG: hypothetical protein IAF94_20265 [Pirellulaceae bacterium]|nr:hypothetical protein [Pirellulaceae bacterium]
MLPRLLWGSVCILTLIFNMPAFAAKVKEKAPPPDENSRLAELVKVGLQAELAGNSESRQLHLQAALDMEPDYAPANWHLAKARVGEEWLSVAKAAVAISKTPQYSFYRTKREDLGGSLKRELNLARWCAKEGMHDRAQFHYSRLLHHPEINESTAKEAIKHLDLLLLDGELRTRAEVEEMQRDTVANDAARTTWEKKFSVWQKWVESPLESKRKLAHEQLHAIDDFHVTPLIESHLLTAGEAWSLELVALLAKFPQPPATTALARAAVLSPTASVRAAALAELKKRKLHDFVPQLVAGLTPQTKSKFLVWIGNDWSVDIRHQAVTEDAQQRLVRLAAEQHLGIPVELVGSDSFHAINPNVPNQFQARINGEIMKQRARAQAQAALERLRETEQNVALQNLLAKTSDAQFYETLEKTTGQKLPREPAAWGNWWTSYNEISYDKPTAYYTQQYQVPLYRPVVVGYSCFIAGTPVYTESGLQSIESIQPGDRVLSQDPNSGELAFKLVQNVTVRPPSKLRKLQVGDCEIVTTLGHPFWVNGSGWKMAKELQPQMSLHTFSGAASIAKVEELPKPDRAYNLVVADYNTYFVGSANVLVHDNIYRQPTLAKVPGLIEAGR